MTDELDQALRRMMDRIRERTERGVSMQEVRDYMRQTLAAHDATQTREGDNATSHLGARARAALLEAIRESGWLCWLLAPLAGLRVRAAERRVGLAQSVFNIATVAQGVAGLAVVVVGAIAPAALAPISVARDVHVVSSVPAGAVAKSTPTSDQAGSQLLDVAAHALPPTLDAEVAVEPIRTGARVGKQERRIYVERWASTWVPGGRSVDHTSSPWVSCNPESTVFRTSCATYDALPEGPWTP